MPNRPFVALATAALLVMSSACSTLGTPRVASDTTPSRSLSSWCQGDRKIRYNPAPEAGMADPGNQYDTDETVAELQQHNARLRAACADSGL